MIRNKTKACWKKVINGNKSHSVCNIGIPNGRLLPIL